MKDWLSKTFSGWENLIAPAVLCAILAGLYWAESLVLLLPK